MANDGRHDIGFTIGLMLLASLVLAVLVFDPGVDKSYAELFTRIFLAGLFIALLLLVASAFLDWDDDDFSPLLWSSGEARGFAQYKWAKLVGTILLIVLFVGVGSVVERNGQMSLIPVINPLDSGSLLGLDQLSGIGNTFLLGLRSGGYAGVGEDLLGWGVVNIITLVLLVMAGRFIDDAKSIMPVVIACGFFASVIWAVLFATGHMLAYGISLKDYLGAAFYGFVSQFTNFLVGAPVSVVSHVLHNFSFVVGIGVALGLWSIASVAVKNGTLAGVLLMKKPQKYRTKERQRTPSHSLFGKFGGFLPVARRGSAMVWFGLVAVVLVVIGLVAYFFPSNLSTLDIGGTGSNACGEYVDAPGPVACTADADCVSALTPAGKELDDGVNLRCKNAVCQVGLDSCAGTVNS